MVTERECGIVIAIVVMIDALKNEWAKNNNISLIRINVSSCKTDKSFVDLYDGILKVHISELTNSLNIG